MFEKRNKNKSFKSFMYNTMVLFENFRTNKKLDFVNFTAL